MDVPCRIGVGGWNFAPWRGTFYPAKLPQAKELAHASRQLRTMEINSTFYGAQRESSFARWHDETPEDFVFTVKGPRYATVRKQLVEGLPSVERFLGTGVARLASKLGPINWQLPPFKRFDGEEIDAFLSRLPGEAADLPLRHALEVRHESFRNPEFVAIARERGVAIVLAGDSDYPAIPDATAPFVYARLMGTQASEKLGYSSAELTRWAKRIEAWRNGAPAPGLEPVAKPQSKLSPRPREVFVYVISGAKERNPLAAMALQNKLP